MKIKITANPITQMGDFSRGDIITSKHYPEAFLKHLVYDCGAAILIEEPKIEIKIQSIETKLNPVKPESKKKRTTKKKRS